MNTTDILTRQPVAIGGVGGSGTRLIAEILRRLGYYMGGDLNEANDNLWFTLLFKRAELWNVARIEPDLEHAIRVFRTAMSEDICLTPDEVAWVESLASADRPRQPAEGLAGWLKLRAESLLQVTQSKRTPRLRWGWKEPNTHIVLDHLQSAFPKMHYIHVMRNGLDMAHSANQNQLKLWGPLFLGRDDYEINPYWSLKYWCHVHRRITKLGGHMSGRFLLFNYDNFCTNPKIGLSTLLTFLGLTVDSVNATSLLALVRPPQSIGRYKSSGLSMFDGNDVAYVKELGFDTNV